MLYHQPNKDRTGPPPKGNTVSHDFSGSTSAKKPPIGLKPRKIHIRDIEIKRFNEVCGAISRYYNEGLKIPIMWIEEYNDLVDEFTA